jgi:hypothetical protein
MCEVWIELQHVRYFTWTNDTWFAGVDIMRDNNTVITLCFDTDPNQTDPRQGRNFIRRSLTGF